jgi:hypothetical protein
MSGKVIPSSLKFWVPGNPTPFATSGEQPWREALVSNVLKEVWGAVAIRILLWLARLKIFYV